MITVAHVITDIIIKKCALSHLIQLRCTHFGWNRLGNLRTHNHFHTHFVSDRMSLGRFHRSGSDNTRGQDSNVHILLELDLEQRHSFGCRLLCLSSVCLAHDSWSNHNSLTERSSIEQAHLAILSMKALLWRDQREWRFLSWVTEFHLVFNITYRLLVFWIKLRRIILEWSIY
jgi:hypothetical protein